MRLIDADALLMKMNLVITMLELTMEHLGLQDDAEFQMELKAYRDIRDGIKDEPTIEPIAQPEQQWIPSSERLPYAEYGESDNVLATCGYRDVEDGSIRWIKTLYFNGGNWCYPTGETYLEKVYAWQPLPEPYRGGDA